MSEPKAEKKRPRIIAMPAHGTGIITFYAPEEADAIFESLETELADTRRALEMAAKDHEDYEPHNFVEMYMNMACRAREQ